MSDLYLSMVWAVAVVVIPIEVHVAWILYQVTHPDFTPPALDFSNSWNVG